MTKVGFVSLGCSKNLVDTEVMLHELMNPDEGETASDVIMKAFENEGTVDFRAGEGFRRLFAVHDETGHEAVVDVKLVGRVGVVRTGTQGRENGVMQKDESFFGHTVLADVRAAEARHFDVVGVEVIDEPFNGVTVTDDVPSHSWVLLLCTGVFFLFQI